MLADDSPWMTTNQRRVLSVQCQRVVFSALLGPNQWHFQHGSVPLPHLLGRHQIVSTQSSIKRGACRLLVRKGDVSHQSHRDCFARHCEDPSKVLGRESSFLASSTRIGGFYCRCVGGSVGPWPSITVPNSVALCGGMTVLSAPM